MQESVFFGVPWFLPRRHHCCLPTSQIPIEIPEWACEEGDSELTLSTCPKHAVVSVGSCVVLHSMSMSTVVLKALCVWDANGKRPGGTLWGRQAPWHVIWPPSSVAWDFPSGTVGKNQPAMQEILEMRVRCLGWEDALQEEMATHSSTLVWRIPWTEETGRVQSVGSQKSQTLWHALWIPKVFTSIHPEATSSVSSVGYPSLFHQEAVIAAAPSVFTPVHDERRGRQWHPAWEEWGWAGRMCFSGDHP